MQKRLYLTGILLCLASFVFSQQLDPAIDRITQFPNKFFERVRNKAAHLDQDLTRQTEKYLEHLAKKEKRLQKKLSARDSAAAKNIFAGVQEKYAQLEQQIKTANDKENKPLSGEYLPYIDSLKGSLSFLQQKGQQLNIPADMQNKISGSLAGFNQLQSKFQLTEQINEFIRQRKQLLSDMLHKYENSLGLNNYLNEYNKQAYYYATQVREYKEMLNDPDKLIQKALTILNKLPAFQDFMKNNSQIAGLFNLPGNYGSPQALEGLQTRDQVQQLIQNQIASGGANGMAALQANLESAHQQLDNLKDKINALGSAGGDIDMPGFRPNKQKTKPFLKRLEYGADLQTSHTTYYFPTTTDIGLSLGYKLNNELTVGVGGSYKIGWGTNFNNIKVTSEGAGLRSFFDLHLKGSFFASGGLEYNYQQPFKDFQQIRSLHDWQQSGLVGVSKIIRLGSWSKVLKKTKMQFLWDFLSYYQVPRTQPLKFRIGYNF